MSKYRVLMLVVSMIAVMTVAALAVTTISVVVSPDNGPSIQYLAQQFNQQNPDIKVDVTIISWETLYPRLLADLSAKTGIYDAFSMDVMTTGAMQSGCLDLTQYFKDHPDVIPAGYDMNDLLPLAYKLGTWNGDLIGLPYYNNTMLFYYRKDLFNNPTYQDQFYQMFGRPLRVPTTWAEAVDVAKFFTQAYNPKSPTRYGIALMFPTTHTMFYMFPLFFGPYRTSTDGIREFGPVNFNYGTYFTSDGKPAFANKYGLMAIQDMKALMPYSPDPLGSDYGQTIEYFAQGMTAMCPQWTNPYLQFASSPALQPANEKIGIAPMPGVSVAGNWALAVNKYISPEKQAAAVKFILFCTTKEAGLTVLEKFAIAPVRESILDSAEAQSIIPWVTALPSIYQTEAFRPRIPQEPQLEGITDVTFSKMLSGALPMTIDTLQSLADQWNKVLAGGQ
ncbi:MAG: extracellular solute-binding protein [Athalassotoga sp.]|uniref:extracellular solute-binding protein n=1 Tax=Athalassotoga sp. TaxID=2022597 RepID=UPI003D015D25